MRIATFNINNVNRRLPNLLHWLAATAPDVVCLQELKCSRGDFPVDAIRKAGYHAVWKGERSWNCVAILARKWEPILIRDVLPGDVDDRQSRYIEVAVEGIAVASIYLPNGNPQPGHQFKYKLEWFDRLYKHATELLAQDAPAVLAGDSWCRLTSIFTRRDHTKTTRCFSQRLARPMRSSWLLAGPTP